MSKQRIMFDYGHITVKAPHPVRFEKLSTVELHQYWAWRQLGNLQCCNLLHFNTTSLFVLLRKRVVVLSDGNSAPLVASPSHSVKELHFDYSYWSNNNNWGVTWCDIDWSYCASMVWKILLNQSYVTKQKVHSVTRHNFHLMDHVQWWIVQVVGSQ